MTSVAPSPTWTLGSAPAAVKSSEFGCRNCLWAGAECVDGARYAFKAGDSCQGYSYYD